MSDDYMAGLHERIKTELAAYITERAYSAQGQAGITTTPTKIASAYADHVMGVLRNEQSNLQREGVLYACQTLQDCITITRAGYERSKWPEPKEVLTRMRRLIRTIRRRAEAGTSLDSPELEALTVTTSQAPPNNQTTPQTEGTPS